MHISEKIKLLRKENSFSQATLGKKIGGDARQISLYETKKISPSIDAIKKLAEVFSISADYFIFENAEKKPLIIKNDELLNKLNDLKLLPEKEKSALLVIINGLITKQKIQALASNE